MYIDDLEGYRSLDCWRASDIQRDLVGHHLQVMWNPHECLQRLSQQIICFNTVGLTFLIAFKVCALKTRSPMIDVNGRDTLVLHFDRSSVSVGDRRIRRNAG